MGANWFKVCVVGFIVFVSFWTHVLFSSPFTTILIPAFDPAVLSFLFLFSHSFFPLYDFDCVLFIWNMPKHKWDRGYGIGDILHGLLPMDCWKGLEDLGIMEVVFFGQEAGVQAMGVI